MLIGYARVSTKEQETHLQLDALAAAGCDVIHQEKRSGKELSKRPVLNSILSGIGPGDTLVILKLDRMARSLKDLLTIIEMIKQSGADFRSLSESIDTSTPMGRMMTHVVGAFAQFERELISERTRMGIQAAVARGSKPGRPRGMSAEDEAEAVRLWHGGMVTNKSELARRYGVHISSIKRAISRAEATAQAELFEA
ncbi:recombinase family protein [Chitinolyticbacter meiyuanensis]|uniref:recombinase family protein n=1 Tax=Chitinolyticbacter meiyuanensis TaxID=682798 RepID=UPI0011E5FDE0|nr:recombinase family protein [Chitinolyticbacter meiyuanensis]